MLRAVVVIDHAAVLAHQQQAAGHVPGQVGQHDRGVEPPGGQPREIQRRRSERPHPQALAGQTADEKLRRYIALFLRRLLAPGHETIHKLIDREMGNPTPALDDLVEQGVRPRLEYLSGVIAEMMACDPSDRRVLRCVMSVQSQSLMYARRNPVAERLGFSTRPSRVEIDEVARHIADFSIGGICAATGMR